MRRAGEHRDRDGVRVGQKSEDGDVPDLVEVVVIVLASPAAVAYGSGSARRSQTSKRNLKAMIRVQVMVKGKVNQMKHTLAVASKLRLRTGSFRLPTWRRPIFNPNFLRMPVAETAADTVLIPGRRLIHGRGIDPRRRR